MGYLLESMGCALATLAGYEGARVVSCVSDRPLDPLDFPVFWGYPQLHYCC